MFQLWSSRILSFILTVLFAASLFAVPQTANAGGIDVPITDIASDRLVGYWDLRDRETFFQVTNTSASNVEIHIQLFNVTTGCIEFNYFDTLTGRDTHVYDVRNLDRNNGMVLNAPDLSDGHGILAVSWSTPGPSDEQLDSDDDDVLTGNFRIFSEGFEYRTNLVGEGHNNDDDDFGVNFNNIDGSDLVDLIVIAYDENDTDEITPTTDAYEVRAFDINENPISCSPIILGCFPVNDFDAGPLFEDAAGGGVINVGINQAVTNSRGGPSVCLGTDPAGWLEFDPNPDVDELVVLLGINNGGSTGSLDNAVQGE